MVSEYRIDNRFEGEMQGLHKPYEEFVACDMRLSTWFKKLDDTDIYEIVALQQAEADLTTPHIACMSPVVAGSILHCQIHAVASVGSTARTFCIVLLP